MKFLLVVLVVAGLIFGAFQWKKQDDARKAAEAAAAAAAAKVEQAKVAAIEAKRATPKPFVSTSSLNPTTKGAVRGGNTTSGLSSGGLDDRTKSTSGRR